LFFSGIGARDGSFQYWRVGRSLGTHCLFLNDGRKHWYQSGVAGLGDSIEATVATIRLWACALGVDEIYAIGQSMGAHGAVLYGSRLGARVLAFGAETILGLEASRSSKMRDGDAEIKYADLQDVMARAEKPIFTFAGERDPVDLYCMGKAQGLPNFHPRTILNLGHDVAAPLHKQKRLIPLMRMFVANQEIPALADEGSALAHPGFAEAFYDLYRHARAGRHEQAAVAGKLSISFYRNSDYAFFLTAKALFALKQAAKALALLENALAIAPRNIDYRFLMARCQARLGEYGGALATHEKIIAERRDYANSFHQIAYIHYMRGDYLKALEASRRAVALRPDNQGFANHLGRIEQKLGDGPRPALAAVTDFYRSFVDAVARRL
jgi:tetratricopeptide (TPR) repeat protein